MERVRNKMNQKMKSDLVIEYAEQLYNSSEHKDRKLPGADISESMEEGGQVHVTRVRIIDQEGEKLIGKPIGHYVTLEAAGLIKTDDACHEAVTRVMANELKKLVPHIHSKKILVAGLGNQDVTPDALGPMTAGHLMVTRHLFENYGKNHACVKNMGNVSAIIPGVMSQTGMETAEIIHGLICETKPDVLIAIDALAARNISRLITTIQISDTGIHPGAGVGNHRYSLTQEKMGIPVVAIGMPTVIDAATIVMDIVCHILDEEDDIRWVQKKIKPDMKNLFVTPKDIDEAVERISYTISEAINAACHDSDHAD